METHDLSRILREHAFFRDLPEKHLETLVGCASNVRFDEGDAIFRAGQEANRFFLIRHGRVALEISIPGQPPLAIQTLGEGEVLGWSWLVPPYLWMLDAIATGQVRAVALDGKCLRGKCEADHDLGYEMLKRFSHVMEERLHATRLQLVDVYGRKDA